MSELNVEIVRISAINEHPNADRLELAEIKGWQCVVGKGNFSPGDKVMYIPIDSVLPEDVEYILFPPDSKITLKNHRVRTIRIRGAISQGMLVDPAIFGLENKPVGFDCKGKLGITKFEPEVVEMPKGMQGRPATNKEQNPNFTRYTSLENIKNYNTVFEDGEEVVMTEKIHGTNFRCGVVKKHNLSWWDTFKRFLGFKAPYEFCYGSRRVQLQYSKKDRYKGFYNTNVYAIAVEKYGLDSVLPENVEIYGEIFGPNIQKGYGYGLLSDDVDVVFFEVKVDGQFLSPDDAKIWFDSRYLPFVPVVYKGKYSREALIEATNGASVLCPEQKVREGCVVRPISETICYMGRKILKSINEEYLLNKNNTDWH